MSYMGEQAFKLAQGIREIIKKYDPGGKLGLSHAIDEYITHWAFTIAQELGGKMREGGKDE